MAWELIVDKKYNQSYKGHAELCAYSFDLGPEQVPGTRWSAQQVVEAHADSLAEEDSELLEVRMWEDASPTWETHYYVEVVATASPLWWNLIIIGALVILVGILIYFIINKTEDIIEYIGEKAPIAIPLLALAGVALGTAVLVFAIRRGKIGETRRAGA
jgi:uncharacterized integral membrane protein